MLLSNYLNIITHYQGKMFITFIGDCIVVLILSFLYPYVQKHFPILIGNRK